MNGVYENATPVAAKAFMTAIMLNLKRIVKILTSVGFKTQSTSTV